MNVFFDIGETLARPDLAIDGRLIALRPYTFVRQVLSRLKDRGHRLGVISNTGTLGAAAMRALLEQAGLYTFFDERLLLFSGEERVTKSSREIFLAAAARLELGALPVFVGDEARERALAKQAGWRVAPHTLLAECVVDGEPLHYARISSPVPLQQAAWARAMQGRALVPLQVARAGDPQLLVVASSAELATLDDLGFYVDRLGAPDAPGTTDVYLLRDDLQKRTDFLVDQGNASPRFARSKHGQWLLSSSPDGLFVALPPTHSIEAFHFHGARHGHTEKLILDPTLLSSHETARAALANFAAPGPRPLRDEDLDELRRITPEVIRPHVERYAGVKSLGDGQLRIRSRHIHHEGNALATKQLLADLSEIGGADFRVRPHRFVHEGKELFNVEAEVGADSLGEVVLVTAHFDSTGADARGYRPELDDAPGADDDASGVAAVLVIARLFKTLLARAPLERRVRFVLFNAEEHGLVGSKAYARDAAAEGQRIVGVYQMDMIGYRRDEQETAHPFEIHVGCQLSREVEQRSLALAERIAQLCERVSPNLLAPQIYGSRVGMADAADGRSDHASFQQRGYAACVVSEDFFAGPHSDSPEAQPNPHYHRPDDDQVSFSYAADIARAVAAAVLQTARGD
jgi:bacterial leucyl aminopeptidase